MYSINIYWVVNIVPNYLLGGGAALNKTDVSSLFMEFATYCEKVQLKNNCEKIVMNIMIEESAIRA